MILSLKTDQPIAELALFAGQKKIDSYSWEAHRELSLEIHTKIEKLLRKNHGDYRSLTGLIVFMGPGSFTGLRIGIAVANALAVGLGVPIAAARGGGWQKKAIAKLLKGEVESTIIPYYGEPAKTTKPKK